MDDGISPAAGEVEPPGPGPATHDESLAEIARIRADVRRATAAIRAAARGRSRRDAVHLATIGAARIAIGRIRGVYGRSMSDAAKLREIARHVDDLGRLLTTVAPPSVAARAATDDDQHI